MASEWKKQLVSTYVKLAKKYSVIGVMNLHKMPTAQLQQMKQKLSDVVMIGGRKRLFIRAIEQAEKEKAGLKQLEKYLEEGLPALFFTNENPFLIYRKISQSRMAAPAKPGDIAPKDLKITAGPTPFAPGPIIGELGRFGVKTSVEAGKVAVKEDTVVAKKGDVITAELSSILLRMGVEPMEIGLDLAAAYEKGLVFGKDVLKIDEAEFMGRIEGSARHAFNLAVNAGILTKETTQIMIVKAFNDAKALCREQNIIADAVVQELIAKANAQMMALKSQIPETEAKKEEAKEEKKEEVPKEEAKEEKKEEKPAEKEEKEQVPKEEAKEEKK